MSQKNIDHTQLIRNCRRPVTAPANVIVHQSATAGGHIPNRLPSAATAATDTNEYAQPSSLSTLAEREQRARIRNAPIEATKSIRDLTTVAKNYVNSQVGRPFWYSSLLTESRCKLYNLVCRPRTDKN